jgi:hypothetical protein
MKLPGLASVLAKTVRILFCEKSPICSLSVASSSKTDMLWCLGLISAEWSEADCRRGLKQGVYA